MKKYIKYSLAVIIIMSNINIAFCQNNLGKADDSERMAIAPFVGDEQGLTPSAKRLLESRIKQVITKNGMAAEQGALFQMKAEVNEISKEMTATSPPMEAYNLEIVLSVVDRITGNIAHSTSIEAKGVGTNETKAYTQAIKQINPASPQLRKFVETAKEKTLEFYNSKCDDILKYANTLITQGKNKEATELLSSVPGISKECYMKCMDLAATIEPQNEESTKTTPEPSIDPVIAEEHNQEIKSEWMQEVTDGVFLSYIKNKTIGEKLIIELQFDNTTEKDVAVSLNKHLYRIFDNEGNVYPCLTQEFTNISRSYINSEILPEIPMKLTLEFKNPPVIKVLQIEVFDNSFKFNDIPIQ